MLGLLFGLISMSKTHGLIFSSRVNPIQRSSGAHRIATYLRQHDCDIEVVDFTPHLPLDKLHQFIRQSITKDTLFFGFSPFFSYWPEGMKRLTAWLKKRWPHITTVLGGQNSVHIDDPNIDIFVDSYGEVAMLDVVRNLAGFSSSPIGYDVAHFGKKQVIKALNRYPAYNLKDYSIIMEDRDYVKDYEWLTIEFSRGCKFKCDFCNFPILGVKEDTSRTAESFDNEMKHNFDKFGVTRYYVADETFNDRLGKISKFADVVEKLPFETFYSGFIRADLMATKPEMITELARMKFGGQYYGIETFNQASGRTIGKGMDPARVQQTILDAKRITSQSGLYRGTISLIVGLPHDNKKNWKRTRNWLLENWNEEGLVVFPLDVQDLSNGEEEYTNVSAFSKNLTKYGLREMPEEKRPYWVDGMINHEMSFSAGNYSKKQFIWEHDSMNWFEAQKISDKIIAELYHKTALDNWQMGNAEMIAHSKLSNQELEEQKMQSKAQSGGKVNLVASPFLHEYIDKKINKF